MGIFDFVKDVGEKLKSGKEKAAAEAAPAGPTDQQIQNQLLQMVAGMGFPIEGLAIEFSDGTATVHGAAGSTPVKENIILAIGNIQGVARVDDRMTVKEKKPESTMYTVKAGDTLSRIAKAHYGDAMRYPAIFEANRPMLTDPDKIYPGQVLRIPPLEE